MSPNTDQVFIYDVIAELLQERIEECKWYEIFRKMILKDEVQYWQTQADIQWGRMEKTKR
jgi:hypothetical protein